jgi:hypothetical protein
MQRQRRRVLGLTTALIAALLIWAPPWAWAVEVGDKAPDFLMFSTVGETVRLSDYQGKKNVLLFFYFRAFGGV